MQVRRLGKHRDFGRDFRGALPCSVIWERGAHCCVESREARRIERLPERMGGATPRNFRGEPGCGRRRENCKNGTRNNALRKFAILNIIIVKIGLQTSTT